VEIDTSNLDVYEETVFQSPASSLNQDQYLFLRGDHVPWLLLSDLHVLELLQANNTATTSTTTTKPQGSLAVQHQVLGLLIS
jgi:hypothetical protein